MQHGSPHDPDNVLVPHESPRASATERRAGRAGRILRLSLCLCSVLWSAPVLAQGPDQADDGLLVTRATRPAVDLAGQLPELSAYLPDGIRSNVGAEWAESWTVGATRGRARRLEVYRQLRLSGLDVDSVGAVEAVSFVEAALDAIGGIERALPLHLSLPYAEAERLWQGARALQAAGRWSEASLLALQSADALREMMPRTVALTLIEAAEAALEAPQTQAVPAEAVRRARRLVQWARSAVVSGNYIRAIPRAYYGCRLMGVILP